MSRRPENVRFLKNGEQVDKGGAVGVSLHCHTLYSRELLDFVPYYAERIPVVSWLWRREMRKRMENEGRLPDFTSGYWEPPLTGRDVFEMESKSLAGLGLGAMVSITDHDSIGANIALRNESDPERTPISMEWTVPFDEAFFHLGIHNIPPERAAEITDQLLAYTRAIGFPDDERLAELFAMLNECSETLVVLNHPIWDIEMIGQQRHERALTHFVARHAKWLHAVEINGFRAWSENQSAIDLADELGLPIISGGDRHCLHSNTMLNVTDAATFSDFAHEIRVERKSNIVVRPEYHVPLPSRQLASIAQILGRYDDFPSARRRWIDRVYLDTDGSGPKTLAEHWGGKQPFWATAGLLALKGLAHRSMRPVIGFFVGDTDIGRSDESLQNELVVGNLSAATER